MKNIVSAYIEKFRKERHERLKQAGILLLLAMLVTSGVTWRLHYTGIALTNGTYCGYEEHTHTADCYELKLVCGYEDALDGEEITVEDLLEWLEKENGGAAEEADGEENTETQEETGEGEAETQEETGKEEETETQEADGEEEVSKPSDPAVLGEQIKSPETEVPEETANEAETREDTGSGEKPADIEEASTAEAATVESGIMAVVNETAEVGEIPSAVEQTENEQSSEISATSEIGEMSVADEATGTNGETEAEDISGNEEAQVSDETVSADAGIEIGEASENEEVMPTDETTGTDVESEAGDVSGNEEAPASDETVSDNAETDSEEASENEEATPSDEITGTDVEAETGETPEKEEIPSDDETSDTPHVHTIDCYELVLTCELEEHTHSVACYSDVTADVETAEDWEASLPGNLSEEDFAGNLVKVASSQLGYTESTANFIQAEDEEIRLGYTRYGAWYGNEYGEWDAMFAAFCVHYAGIPEEEFPVNSGAYAWAAQLKELGLYATAGDYIPEAGDLIFFDTDEDGKADRVGIVEAAVAEETDSADMPNAADEQTPVTVENDTAEQNSSAPENTTDGQASTDREAEPEEAEDTVESENDSSKFENTNDDMDEDAGAEEAAPVPNVIYVIEGDYRTEGAEADAVCENQYAIEDAAILGYGLISALMEEEEIISEEDQNLPEVELTEQTLEAVCDDIIVTVSGLLPEGARVEASLLDDVEIEDTTVLFAMNIAILLEDGTEYEPEEDTITVTFVSPSFDGKGTTVYTVYYVPEEGEPELLDTETGEGTVSFDAEHFSTYAVTASEEETATSIVASGTCGTNLTWTLDGDGVLTISGTGEMTSYSSGGAPWYSYRSSITSVVIENEATTIGNYAFYGCTSLAEITVPESVTSIGSYAFYGCSSLASITIPDGVTNIPTYTFYNCTGLTSITLPEKLTSIGNYAFRNCTSLENITLPDGVTNIGNYAFYGCSSLASITIPDGVTNIPTYTFYNCTGLTSITLPEKLTSIGNYAFRNCTSLENITLPDGVTNIGNYAFYGCSSLASITIPDGVTNIPTYTFYNCTGLTSITLPEKLTSIGNYAFQNCISLECMEIPGSTISIGDYAFQNCTGLTSITLPEELTSIGNYAFQDCISLECIEIPGSMISIGDYAFQNCAGITNVTFAAPSNIENMGAGAFSDCISLAEVNGQSSMVSALMLFTNESVSVTEDVFYNTLLGDGLTLTQSEKDGTAAATEVEKSGITLTLGARQSAERLTGQSERTNFVLEVTDSANLDDVTVRVYVYFENDDGLLYDGGMETQEVYLTDSSGNTTDKKISITIHAVNGEDYFRGFYCLEITGESLIAGMTMNFYIDTLYDSPTSGGGKVWIFGEILNNSDVPEIHWPTENEYECQEIEWTTKTADYSLTKTGGSGGTFSYSDDLNATVYSGMTYTIKLTSEGNGSNDGKDYVDNVTFTDTLTLPNGLEWMDGLEEAIQEGNYRIFIGTASRSFIYVTVDGVAYTVCRIENPNYSSVKISDIDLFIEDKTLTLTWTLTNKATKAEIDMGNLQLIYQDVILVSDEVLETSTVEISNKVTAEETFHYSSESKSQSAERNSSLTLKSNVKLTKTSSRDSSMQYWQGETNTYTITLSNTGSLSTVYTDTLIDNMTKNLYMKPEDMQVLFDADAEHQLTITLSNAALGDAYEKELVMTVEGDECYVSIQNTGQSTEYAGKSTTDPEKVTDSSGATITIGWGDSDNLQLSYSYMNTKGESITGTLTIGEGQEYSSIEESLNAIGYYVDNAVTYQLEWKFPEEGITLLGGQNLTYTYNATNKDTLMFMTGGDHEETDSSGTGSGYQYLNHLKSGGSTVNSVSVSAAYINNDFALKKGVSSIMRDGNEIEDDDTKVEIGDVISYTTSVTHHSTYVHSGTATYEALPLVDRMNGGQILLVPADFNEELSILNLEVTEINGVSYYQLIDISEDGSGTTTYEGVYIQEGVLADHVTVSSTADGALDTMIYCYLPISGSQTKTITYMALVSPASGDLSEESSYSLYNQVWLGDHSAHRLWDSTCLVSSVLKIEKEIVTDLGDKDDPGDDETATDSIIDEGEKVTYRFTLQMSETAPITITGSSIYDKLPETISSYAWDSATVTDIRFVAGSDAEVDEDELSAWSISRDDSAGTGGWYVTNQNPEDEVVGSGTQYYLRWTDDLSLTFTGTIYVYVTLQFPSDAEWDEFSSEYKQLVNELNVYELTDQVYHSVKAVTEVYLQKGVYSTGGIVNSSKKISASTEQDSLYYYENDSALLTGIVQYYVVLYNDGDTYLYLTEMQDILPTGFTYLHDENNSRVAAILASTEVSVQGFDETAAENKTCTISYETSEAGDGSGRQAVTFTFSNEETIDNLAYSSVYEMYYLEPGEALVFSYYVNTNEYNDTEDAAENLIAMPFYDYCGGGVEAADRVEVTVSRTVSQGENDGSCDKNVSAWAKKLGLNGSGEYEYWLASDVMVYRSAIEPGLLKSTSQTVVSTTDTVNWELTVWNSGRSLMTDYVITDVMEYPYYFYGDVSYTLYDLNHGLTSSKVTLFTISGRTANDDKSTETLTLQYISNSSGVRTETETVTANSDPVEITAWMNFYGSTYISVTLRVGLQVVKDDNDNPVSEILSIEMVSDSLAIPAGGHAVLGISTKPNGSVHRNTVYYNTSYLTPTQGFDTVVQGSSTEYTTMYYTDYTASVVSGDQVTATYGYATTAEKSVTELNIDGDLSDNTASSSSRTSNYITLLSEDSEFQYKMQLTYASESDTYGDVNRMVIIDNLPQQGDVSAIGGTDERYSAFTVNLASDPEFSVSVSYNADEDGDGTKEKPVTLSLTQGTDYVVEYSTKSTSFSNDDWNGVSSTDWTSSATGARSFRIIFQFHSAEGDGIITKIPAGAVITVTFNAVIADGQNISPSSIAWNSYGYRYGVTDHDFTLESGTKKVGVQTPSAPSLTKELQNSSGLETTAEEAETFTYVIYPGTGTVSLSGSLGSDGTETSQLHTMLQTALKEAGITSYTVATVTVNSGDSSASIQADAMKNGVLSTWSYDSAGETWNELAASWTWADDTQYTVMEFENTDSDYTFASWNTATKTNSYTFTYDSASTQSLICVNQRPSWTLYVNKVDTDTQSVYLPGAVFGLYSQNQNDQMSKDDYDTLLEANAALKAALEENDLKYDDVKQISVEVEVKDGNGTVTGTDTEIWYLSSLNVTGSGGTLSFSELVRENYYLVELAPPDSYAIVDSQKQTLVSCTDINGAVSVTIANNLAYELPSAGGAGTGGYTMAGLLLMSSTAYLLYRKKSKKEAAGR
ncbi:MAG: leucine-rich repeat protein [Lachnospiraceae bacterium]|nr:leucine-rich repeat protein [Lachnospiraceae bacterium]